ncbi:tetratricopeptide repeat protein [Nocardia sp. NPDC055321]
MEETQLIEVSGVRTGSGYLIAARLVLTSAHVVGSLDARVRLSRPTVAVGDRYDGTVVWCGRAGERDDAALVHVDDPRWRPPRVTPVVWGRLVTHRPGTRCQVWGLPDFARHHNRSELQQVLGTISPGSGLVGNRHIVEVATQPPADLGDSPWAGISGAAVYCGDLLTGVVAADPEHRRHGALVAVPAYVLLADPRFRAALDLHTGPGGTRWEPVELQPLMDVQSSPRTGTGPASPSSLLLARHAVVPFRPGREELLEQLHRWAQTDDGAGAWLLHGRGGQGKTRLAQQFADQLTAARWSVLWLARRPSGPELAVTAEVRTPLLVIVDYAETRTTQIRDLLTTLAGSRSQRPVKVLLLARFLGEWWNQIAYGSSNAGDIIERATVTELRALDDSPVARQDTYRAAVTAFAAALPALPGPNTDVDWPGTAHQIMRAPVPAFDTAATALTVQMGALLALLDTTITSPSTPVPGRSFEDRVLEHEHRYWEHAAASYGLVEKLGLPTLKDAVAATAVLAPTTTGELDDVLAKMPELTDQPTHIRKSVHAWLMGLYPGHTVGGFSGLAPDRLAEHVVGRLMIDSRRCVIDDVISTPLVDPQIQQLLTVCTRASAHPAFQPTAGQQLTDWCRRHPATLLINAVTVATRVEVPGPLIDALEQSIEDPATSLETLERLRGAVPRSTHALASLAADLTGRLTERYRSDGQSPATNPRLALALNDLTARMGELGRLEDGLTAADEAIRIYRTLADARPDDYVHDLTMTLINTANLLGLLQRFDDGLTMAAEAVSVCRTQARAPAETRLPDLAASLATLTARLGDLGRFEEALAAAEEATQLYGRLADADPGRHLPDYALVLNSLAIRHRELSRFEEALAAAERAVEIYRGLADADPDAYLGFYARNLTHLAEYRGALNGFEEALAAAEGAVEIYRRLVRSRPGTYLLPDFALSLVGLAIRRRDLGQLDDALTAGEEAVEIYRTLVDTRPDDLYRPERAVSLGVVADIHTDRGQSDNALTVAYEASQVFHGLAVDRPDQHIADYAVSLNKLAARLDDVNRFEDGLTVTETVVGIYRSLVDKRPNYLPDLATTLINLTARRGALRRNEEALTAIEDAVQILRRLAAVHPDTYGSDLATSLYNLAVVLRSLGRFKAALTAISEAVQILGRHVAAQPAAVLPLLSTVLVQQAIQLGELHRFGEGLSAIKLAVKGYQKLTEMHGSPPPELDQALAILAWMKSQAMA